MRAEDRALCVRGFAISAARPVLARLNERRGDYETENNTTGRVYWSGRSGSIFPMK